MKNGCVPVGNTDMYYACFGKGERKLVVLPGLSDGLATVKGKAPVLSLPYRKFLRDYTVYMFSRKNEMPEGYAMEDMADDQVLVMRSLGIERACLMGVSQGGMIAQCIAVRHPDTVSKLILAVTAPNANVTVQAAVKGWMEMAKNGDHATLMADTAEKMYSEKYLRKNRKYLSLLARFTKPSGYERFMKNACAILNFDGRESLSKITCPTLIIAGSDDRTVGNEAALELNRGIAGSRLYVYEGLGHGAFEEAKDFYDRVVSFCDTGP
ncbi:MAG: alpha/beta hydrolase [Clostridia bacterium]|nr:alpha/beta hydrolase [Clostridia bacterium]